jgi:hypothetical protein
LHEAFPVPLTDQKSREVFSAFNQAEQETVTVLQHRVLEHLAWLGEMER